MADDGRLNAILHGAALGGALGAQVCDMTLRQIKMVYGPEGIRELPANPKRGPHTAALLQLAVADDGQAIETFNPAACVAGLAYRHHADDASLFRALARTVPDVDEHPAALAATVGAGYMVAATVQGIHINEYVNKTMLFCDGISDVFDTTLLRIGHVLGWVDEDAALKHIGSGQTAVEMVVMALYCVLRYDDDFIACVCRAANTNGDSAAIAAIAGAIMGARLGDPAQLPQAWLTRLAL